MAGSKLGYYTQDTGDGDFFYYYMGDEPPLEQYIFVNGAWEPLSDPWYLMDQIIEGNPEISDPAPNPPESIPAFAPSGTPAATTSPTQTGELT